jgi:protein SERAC1
MTGPPTILVNSWSATHGRSWENKAHHVQALNRTHSDLVKFPSHDGDYTRVLDVLKSMAAAIAFCT